MGLKGTLNGTTYCSVPDGAANRDMGAYAVWFTLNSTVTASGGRNVIAKGVFASGNQVTMTISRDAGTAPNYLTAFLQFSTTTCNVNCGFPLTFGKPYFGCATFDVPNKTLLLYLGDLLSPPRNVTTVLTGNPGAGTRSSDTGSNLVMLSDPSALANGVPGTIHAAAIYADVLTLAQVTALWYQFTANLGTRKGLWFPGMDGTATVIDRSGNGNTGTITGAIPTADILLHPTGIGPYQGLH